MGIAINSGASRGFLIKMNAQLPADATQNSKAKLVAAEAVQEVRQQRNAGTANTTGVLTKIGNALKAVATSVVNTAQRVNRNIDALVKKSPVLSFALGLTAAVFGLGLLAGGVAPLGIPLAVCGLVLATKAFDPFLRSAKKSLLDKKPMQRESTPLLQGNYSSTPQPSSVRKAD